MVLLVAGGILDLQVRSNRDGNVLSSKMSILAGVWTRAVITSYKGNISFVVTNLEGLAIPVSDSIAANHEEQTDGLFNGNVELVLGGFNNSMLSKGTQFDGCIHLLKINSSPQDLNAVSLDMSCCHPVAETTTFQAFSMNGFGYAYLDIAQEFLSNVSFSLSLRSYSYYGDIISLIGTDNSSLVTLRLVDGRIQLSTHTSASVSLHRYNIGLWVDITCSANHTSLSCFILSDSTSDSLNFSVSAQLAAIMVAQVLLGTEANNADRFAGCVANLTVNQLLVDPWLDVNSFRGLLPYCPNEVEEGLSLEANTLLISHQLLTAVDIFNVSAEVTFLEASGSVLSLSSQDFSFELGVISFYPAVWLNISEVEHTVLLSSAILDSQFHILTVVLNGTRILISLDRQVHVEQRLDRHVQFAEVNTTWLMQLGDYGSTHMPSGFTGGLRQLYLNSRLIPLASTSIYTYQYLASLNGVILPQLTRTSQVDCPTPVPSQFSPIGLRFGDQSGSYALFSLANTSDILNTRLAVRLRFRAVAPEGLLFYVSDEQASPTQWMAVLLVSGHLRLTMQTSNLHSDSFMSHRRYADGNWYTLTIIRYHNFAALVIDGDDYANNGQDSAGRSYLNIGSPVFVGGFPSELRESLPPAVNADSFHGCIDYVVFNSFSTEEIIFNLTSPDKAYRTRPCYEDIEDSFQIVGAGFIHLASGLRVSNDEGLTLSMRLRSRQEVYSVMTVLDHSQYATLFVNKSEIGVTIAHINGGSEEFRVDIKQPDIYQCNLSVDSLTVLISARKVQLTVGNEIYQFMLTSMAPFQLINAELYIGDVPDDILVAKVNTESTGYAICMGTITLNGKRFSPDDFVAVRNVTLGCL
ncbi:laminin subunit alpha-1-like [Watersipora subatra]|uniref:laminin subunit alpha-1-like n=1 Tax=Watersipora subatra TaxID=2589382 RepID=UPI00355C3002